MKTNCSFTLHRLLFFGAAFGLAVAQSEALPANPAIGPTGVIVQSQFGGQIFGFDIDQASNEGILCEAQTLENGRTHAAVETFSQTTGRLSGSLGRPRVGTIF